MTPCDRAAPGRDFAVLFVALAFAHPGSGSSVASERDVIGHRLAIAVGANEVRVDYVAEVPERRVLADAREEPEYGKKLLAQLGDNVKITWNGEILPATPVAVTDAVKAGEGGFLDFANAWTVTLPSHTGKLGIRNGNFPGEPGFFATSVTLDGSVLGTATSLLKVRDGRIRDNWHGAWVRDEAAREPWVELRPAGWFERVDAPEPLPRRMVGLASEGAPWWWNVLGGIGLVGIAALGRWMGQRARR